MSIREANKEETWAILLGLEPTSWSFGDSFPIDEFIDDCNQGNFIDYDGHGYWATETHYQREGGGICPSDITKKLKVPPHWATHVQ